MLRLLILNLWVPLMRRGEGKVRSVLPELGRRAVCAPWSLVSTVAGLFASSEVTSLALGHRTSRATRTAAWAWSGHCVPPLEGEGLPAYVGATVDLPEQLMVREIVVNEDAVQAERLQQGTHLLFQAAAAIDEGPEGFGDAQVLA
jgi:hypothetical protein